MSEVCLGIPGRVVDMVEGYGGQLALVDVEGAHRKVNIGMLEDQSLAPGEWVLIHMGFAVERVDAAGAERAMEGLQLMGRAREDPEQPLPEQPSAEPSSSTHPLAG
ncbi:MAG TPA: HypC/HybG/HupF family hydrogenase formation chaperone [Nocardioidaceae bacterium]|nr:HypC/HybG/HupF family hydrogenase formation chaperone [Nocardioidaceae bacterium]